MDVVTYCDIDYDTNGSIKSKGSLNGNMVGANAHVAKATIGGCGI